MLITLFIQAFRMGAEPFFFSHAKEKNSRETFARIMNIFVAVCMSAFLVVMLFLDLFKWFIPNPAYHEGLRVVPILMLANVFLGIYYNQSVWYKLTDRTQDGWHDRHHRCGHHHRLQLRADPCARATWAARGPPWPATPAWPSISYVWGQKHYPIPYNVSRVLAVHGRCGGAVVGRGAVAARGCGQICVARGCISGIRGCDRACGMARYQTHLGLMHDHQPSGDLGMRYSHIHEVAPVRKCPNIDRSSTRTNGQELL